jgi:hypothetical protein
MGREVGGTIVASASDHGQTSEASRQEGGACEGVEEDA